jgi:hypothetical protein
MASVIVPEVVDTITLLPEDGATNDTHLSFLLGLPVVSLHVPAGPSEVKPVVNKVFVAEAKFGATVIVAAVKHDSPAVAVKDTFVFAL